MRNRLQAEAYTGPGYSADMKKILGYSIGAVAFAFAVIVVYSFLLGKLFPFSPIILGFEKHELGNAVVYTQGGNGYEALNVIDSLIPIVERFHEMRFARKPRIFIFKDADNYRRRSISKARFCVYYNGDMVISPHALKEAEKNEISLGIYLEHELSHSLLFQHAGLIGAYRYPEWLLEGTAVYSSKQMGTSWYPSKGETYDYIRNGNFMPPEYFKTGDEDRIELDVEYRVTFMYSEFACIVDYLITEYGKAKFLHYIKQLTRDSGHDGVFKEIYGADFGAVIQEFRRAVLRSRQ